MRRPIRLLEARRADGGGVEVLSPGVGWWSRHPGAGSLVGPGSLVGGLEIGNRRYDLVLPEGIAGRVSGPSAPESTVPVAFGEVLFRLEPVDPSAGVEYASDAGRLGHPAGADLPEGAWAVTAPTDGVFYARPSPDAPAFVGVGDRVREGQTVGLVEVMKTFNPIAFGGPGYPAEGEIVEVRAEDGAEIRAGEILIVVR